MLARGVPELRAIFRLDASKSGLLLPFLYQTSTIQRFATDHAAVAKLGRRVWFDDATRADHGRQRHEARRTGSGGYQPTSHDVSERQSYREREPSSRSTKDRAWQYESNSYGDRRRPAERKGQAGLPIQGGRREREIGSRGYDDDQRTRSYTGERRLDALKPYDRSPRPRYGNEQKPERDIDGGDDRTYRYSGERRPPDSRATQVGDRTRAPRADHVPFDTTIEEQEATLEEEDSTITPSERRAFEQLFKLRKKSELAASKETDDAKSASARSTHAARGDHGTETSIADVAFPVALHSLAEEARLRRLMEAGESGESAADALRETTIKADFDRTATLMHAADTDMQLYNLMQIRVLDRVAALKLDGPSTGSAMYEQARAHNALVAKAQEPTNKRATVKTEQVDASIPEIEILTTNLPKWLTEYTRLLRSNFPTSHLSASLLPLLKTMGASAFELGATTEFYNAHLATFLPTTTAASPQSERDKSVPSAFPLSLPAFVQTLEEMDAGVYSFDHRSLSLVNKALDAARQLQRGEGGELAQSLVSMDAIARSVKKLVQWRKEIQERRLQEALTEARAEAAEAEGMEENAE